MSMTTPISQLVSTAMRFLLSWMVTCSLSYHSFPLSSSHNNRFPKKIANGYLHCSHASRASEPTFSSLRSGIISCGQRCQVPAATPSQRKMVWSLELKRICSVPPVRSDSINLHQYIEIWQPWSRLISASFHEKMDFFEEPPSFLPSVTDTATAMRKHSENSNHQASKPFFYVG